MRRAVHWFLLAIGGSLVFLAVPTAYLNRTVLDSPTFAANVNELRQLDEVSAVLGREVSEQLIAANPDLVAIAPLVEQVSTAVVGSDALSGPVTVAASQFHQAMTTGDSDQLVLRIADAGAVVASVIGAVAPERAPRASDAAATLVSIGSQEFAADVIGLADTVDTLAWLFPVLALLCLVGAVLVERDRWTGIRRVGWSGLIASGLLAAVLVAGAVITRAGGGDARADALVDGVWEVFVRPVWWPIGLVATVGALLVMVGSGRAAAWSPAGLNRRIAEQPRTPVGTVVRALAFVAVGVATIVEPRGMLTLVAFAVGVLLVVSGIGALARLAPGTDRTAEAEADEKGVRLPIAVAAGIGMAVLLGLVIWAARSPDDEVAGAAGGAVAGTGEVCNGHAALCERRFDQVSYAATHNAMAVVGKPGWFLGEQGLDIVPQLDFGVRALLVDVWYGVDAGNGKVRTAAGSYEEALAVANEELGEEIVQAALRVVDAVAPGDPQGEPALYMCHGLCETGATSFETTLLDIRAWLATHPDEVISIFIEDHVDATDVGALIEETGLADYAYTPEDGEPFPTLGEMIRSGRRLLVMLEEGDGRPDHPWLVNGFELVQETPYTFPTAEDFSCDENRGEPDAPLLQINHWLSGFTNLVSSAQEVNAADVLGPRVEECQRERGMQPTFVAVNFVEIGDVLAVVDDLNGVG